MAKYIWVKDKKFYYYGTYTTWKKAYNIARTWKRRNRSSYFIIKKEGFYFSQPKYDLYLTKAWKLGF